MSIIATIAEILVRIGADTQSLTQGLSNSASSIGRFSEKATSASKGVAVGVGLAGAAIAALGLKGMKMAADMQQTEIAFATLIGDAKQSKIFLADLNKFAAKTPFTMPGLLQASKGLLAFGFEAQEVIPIMTKVGDAVAAVGGGEEQINAVVSALGKIKANGKVSREEMLMLTTQGIGSFDILQKKFHMTGEELNDAISKGAIGADMAITALTDGMGEKFAGAMDVQSKSMNGIFSTIKDNASQILITVGDSLLKAFNVGPILTGVGELVSKFNELSKAIGLLPAIKEMLPPGTDFAIFLVAGAIMGALVPAMWALVTSIAASVVALAPFIAAGIVVAAIAYGIYKAWNPLVTFFTTTIPNAFNATIAWFTTLVTNIGIMKNNAIAKVIEMVNTIVFWFQGLPGKILAFIIPLPGRLAYYFGLGMGIAVRAVINGITSIIKWFTTLPGRVQAQVQLMKIRAIALFMSMKVQAISLATSLVNGVVNFIATLPSRISAQLSRTWSQVKSWFSRISSSGRGGANQMVSGVTSSISSLPGKFASMGRNIVSKVAGFAGQLYSKARNMGARFWAGFKKGLGIGSPSYVELAFMSMQDQALKTVDSMKKMGPKLQGIMSTMTPPQIGLASASTNGVGIGSVGATGQAGIDAVNNVPTQKFNSQEQSGSGVTIHVAQMVVRDQSDILKIAQELFKLQQTRQRGSGTRVVF